MRQPRPVRKSIVRYLDRAGRQVPKGTPGARRVRTETDTYYASIGGEKVSLGTKDLGKAWAKLLALQRRERERAAGLTDDVLDQAARPFREHVEDWLATLTAAGAPAKRVGTVRARVLLLAELGKWRRLGDVTADSATLALSRLQNERGRSAQTRNHYLAHLGQFVRWCLRARPRRLRENPLEGVGRANVETDRRHARRCPTDDEVARLFAYLDTDDADRGGPDTKGVRARAWDPADPCRPIRQRMNGRHRALGYKVAMATGLRADEVRSLTRSSFDLDAPAVTLPAAADKRRKGALQPLPSWLARELRAWFASGGGCWDAFPENHPGLPLKHDLECAGVPYSVPGPDGPEFFDFHSLRVWYVTALANQPGISPKTLMELARHSTPALTLRVYAKARRAELHASAEQLPEPGRPENVTTTKKIFSPENPANP